MARPSAATTLVVALLAILGLMAVALTQRARSQRAQARPAAAAAAAPAAPVQVPTRQLKSIARVAPAPRVPSYTVLRVRGTVRLRSKPHGRVLATVGSTTQFGSPATLTVGGRRGDWLGVTSTDLPNGKLGWVKADRATLAPQKTRMSIRIDLSKRRLQLVKGRRVLRTATVGIGRP